MRAERARLPIAPSAPEESAPTFVAREKAGPSGEPPTDRYERGATSLKELGRLADKALSVVRDGSDHHSAVRASLRAVAAFFDEVNKGSFGRLLNRGGVPLADAERFVARMTELLGVHPDGDFDQSTFWKKNAGIGAFNVRMLNEDNGLAIAAHRFHARVAALDEGVRSAQDAERGARGIEYWLQSHDDDGAEAGRDFCFDDRPLAAHRLGVDVRDVLIDEARASLPDDERGDEGAILRRCGQMLLLLHDDCEGYPAGAPCATWDVVDALGTLPRGRSVVFMDWLAPLDDRGDDERRRAYLAERLRATTPNPIASGSIRHGFYHLNASTAVYILAAADLGASFRAVAPQVQRRIAAEYKHVTSDEYRGPEGRIVRDAVQARLPGLYVKARRGTLGSKDVVGDATPATDPFRALWLDRAWRQELHVALAQAGLARSSQNLEELLVHEQALLFHTARTAELHGGGQQAAAGLKTRIQRVLTRNS